jgi:hypothetical protein
MQTTNIEICWKKPGKRVEMISGGPRYSRRYQGFVDKK